LHKKEKGKMKKILASTLLIVCLIVGSTSATLTPLAKADSSQTIEWNGWWVEDTMVTEAYITETITAKVRITNEPSGRYRMRIMEDFVLAPDSELDDFHYDFDYDGGDHIYSLSFSTLYASGGRTRGYYVDVLKKEWWGLAEWGWAEKWTMPDSYPPRLKMLPHELWIKLADAPEAISGGGDVEFYRNSLYIIRGGETDDFWKLDLNTLSWTNLANTPEGVGLGGGMTFDGQRYMYAVRGTSWGGLIRHRDFWTYDLDRNVWEKLPDTPEDVGSLGSILYADGYVYLRPGGSLSSGFYRYNINSQTWEKRASGPRVGVESGPSTAMAYDGERYIYTFQGGQDIPPAEFLFDDVWRYDTLTDSWLELEDTGENHDRADLLYVDEGLYAINKKYIGFNFEFFDLSSKKWFSKPDIPCGIWSWDVIGDGASLTYDGSQYIYALNGGGNKRIWRYRIYKTPDFYISAKAKQVWYRPEETTETTVIVKNNRAVKTTFWVNVSFKDSKGEYDKYNPQISVTPTSATLDPGQSTTFSVTWTIPADAPKGGYQIAINCWRDSTFTQSYTDNLDWAFIFYVYELNILTPTSSAAAIVGDPSNPNQVLVSVEWIPRWLLLFMAPTFDIEINHQQATYELTDLWNQLFGIYTLKVSPPTVPSEGLYDLSITATFAGLTDTDNEENAIKYVVAPSAEPIQKGLAWLRAQQYADGSWRGSVGVTSLAVLAFLNSGYDETDATVSKAINYILSNVKSDGSIYNSYPTYETSLAILPLVATHKDTYEATIENARNWLVGAQQDETFGYTSDNYQYGGWTYGPYQGDPDLSNTQFALLALDAANLPKTDPTWSKAVIFTQRCQNRLESNDQAWAHDSSRPSYNDGGFIYRPWGWSLAGGTASYGSMTGAGIWGLLLCGVPKTDERVVAAMNWVRSHCTWDTNPGIGWWRIYYYYLSMSKALTMYGQPLIDGHDWYQELYNKIVGMQIDAGSGKGYWSTSNEDDGPELTTAYAILSLQTRAIAPPVQRLSYLTFILRSNCLIGIIDSEGNLVGYNYINGLGENNVPRAVYSGPFFEPQYIIIVNPQAGTYRLELIGVSEGPYELTIQGNYGEEVTDIFEYAGEIKPAELHGCDVTVTAIVGPIDIYANPPEFEEVIGYYLTVTDNIGGFSDVSAQSGWKDECTWVTLTAPEYVPSEEGEDGVRYKFGYWDIDGTPVAGNPIDVHVDAPHAATAHYTVQYYLTVKTDPAGIATIPGEGWYDECTCVTLTAPLESNVTVKYHFAYWTVEAATYSENSIQVHMDGPKTATAVYKDYLGHAKEEINCLRTYVTQLYSNRKIGRIEYNHFMWDIAKIEKDIDRAIKNLDKERAGYDDKMMGFEDLRHAVMKLKHMIKDIQDWARRRRIPTANATWIIGELENIRMKLVSKARAEALAERALALKAIEDAKSKGKDTTKAEEEIAKVNCELAKAEQKIAEGKLAQAIQHFKHAFAHSQHAVKKAYNPTWTINYKDWIDELEEEDP
jgi:squalene-hopene/tetraprenyl-beta-curcumene cyclase